MSRFLSILIVSFFLINCTSNTIIEKPENLISKNEMVDLLTDMFLASGAENIKNIQLKRKVNYFPLVFEKYGIDSTRFKESNYYYTSRIDDYEEIMKRVDSRLKGLRTEFDKRKMYEDSINKAKRDSLRFLNKPKIKK